MTVTNAMRSPNSEPDLAEFEQHVAAAMACSIITCTAWNAEVHRALDAARDAAPDVPKRLIDAAYDAFLAQVADPRPWWQQNEGPEL